MNSLELFSSRVNHVAGINLVAGRLTKLKRIVPFFGSAVARPPSINTSSPTNRGTNVVRDECDNTTVQSRAKLISHLCSH